jgi:hypothetical protein
MRAFGMLQRTVSDTLAQVRVVVYSAVHDGAGTRNDSERLLADRLGVS